jgi:hypothetical protein
MDSNYRLIPSVQGLSFLVASTKTYATTDFLGLSIERFFILGGNDQNLYMDNEDNRVLPS